MDCIVIAFMVFILPALKIIAIGCLGAILAAILIPN